MTATMDEIARELNRRFVMLEARVREQRKTIKAQKEQIRILQGQVRYTATSAKAQEG